MKKFFTVISLQKEADLIPYLYTAMDNSRLQTEVKTAFPIMTAAAGYLESGEETEFIAVYEDSEDGKRNLQVFKNEIAALCNERCIKYEVKGVEINADSGVAAQMNVFRRLIDFCADNDELFACMTFGTKPLSNALIMAVQYAYRVFSNTSLSCIVYGQIIRSGMDKTKWYGNIYDMTAMLQMGEIVNGLAARGVRDPRAVIDGILSM